MCFSKPNIPVPPPIQEAKPADTMNANTRKKQKSGMAGSSLLTGPSGVAASQLNTGGTSLLGG